MKCSNCAAEVNEKDRFCGECGETLTKTSLGLNEAIEGLLCYSLGWLTGLIFLAIEKNKFVRFHAFQSLATFLSLSFLSLVLLLLVPGGIFLLIVLLEFILWMFLMYKAYRGVKFKLPIVGGFAEKQSK